MIYRQSQPGTLFAPHNGTSTSKAAAKAARPRVNTDAIRIAYFIDAMGAHGATQPEISFALGIERATVAARCNGLERNGRIVKSHKERSSPSGRPCAVYVRAGGAK
ncbi:MAG: MarR family transcriptional regulator [Planctomycetes bacterium]|nr:MarR family transcriptional regulator [Planctomycetota bacterium]